MDSVVDSTARLNVRRAAAVARGVASASPVFAARASNAEIWDTDGKRYLDFAGGIGTLATGHRHPRVLAAVREQLDRFTHTAFQVMAYEPYVRLAERLNALAPFRGPARTLLLTTGAEAVENAVKIAPGGDRALGSDRVHRRISWPHPAGHGSDWVGCAGEPDGAAAKAVPARALCECDLQSIEFAFPDNAGS